MGLGAPAEPPWPGPGPGKVSWVGCQGDYFHLPAGGCRRRPTSPGEGGMGERGVWGRQAWSLGPPTPLPPPPCLRAPHPATQPVALPLPAWQAAWPGPFSKEAHFLPPRARLDEPGAPHRCGSYPCSYLHPRARAVSQLPSTGAQHPLPVHPSASDPRPCAPVPTSPDPSAATSEGWSRDAAAPAACSPWVPARAHAGPQAHLQPCPWTPDKARRTDPQLDSMDRSTLPPVVALLLAVCSLRPTSRCPGTPGGQTWPQVFPASGLVPSSCPVGPSEGVWTAPDGHHRVTNHPGLAGRRTFSPESLKHG